MATKTATTIQQRPARRTRLTNTNTDLLCCDADPKSGGVVDFLKRSIYRINLWTGLYMLNPRERATFHIFGLFVVVSFILYVIVFWKGFIDGYTQKDE